MSRINSFELEFYNGLMLIRKGQPFCVRTIRNCTDEDWKTAVARNKPFIPGGTNLTVSDVVQNLFGRFLQVEYSGMKYSIRSDDCNYFGLAEVRT